MNCNTFYRMFVLTPILLASLALHAGAGQSCQNSLNTGSLTALENSDDGKPVYISHSRYNELMLELRKTLSGNLATVFRSEWKTKLSVSESNKLIRSFAQELLPRDVYDRLSYGLDRKNEAYTRTIHGRLAELSKQRVPSLTDFSPEDVLKLSIRDNPPPPGVKDTTFTFYLRPLLDSAGQGEGKHQVRVRNYIRTVDISALPELKIGEFIPGYSAAGKPFQIKRVSELIYLVGDPQGAANQMTLSEIKVQYGRRMSFFAPHGGKYKLEIKTSLLDKISDEKFKKLAGYHMVQKLDVSLTPFQVEKLFAPLTASSPEEQRSEALTRIEQLNQDLKNNRKNRNDRIDAVLSVLSEGVKADSHFLRILGATYYNRSAFESPLGFQLTVDRDQKVFHSEIYGVDPETTTLRLQSPMEIMKTKSFRAASKDAARHVELKLPYFAVQGIVGLELTSSASVANIPVGRVDGELEKVVRIYSDYVSSTRHPGKFVFLMNHGTDETTD